MTTMLIAGDMGNPRETTLDRTQLDGLLTGNTLYLEVPPGGPGGPHGGTAVCFYGGNGLAAFKLPTGTTLRGPWRLKDDCYCADWENGPKNSCSKMVKADGFIAVVDVASGQKRAHVQSIVPGNPEKL